MSNLVLIMVLFCVVNTITLIPYLTNADGDETCCPSCQSNGPSSPPYNPSGTSATLTLNDFSRGGDGGAESRCDGEFHPTPEKVVALSTGWYDNGSRCGKMITITASNGRTAVAKVVDECDSVHGCDEEHAGQPPCRIDIVDASETVWEELGLTTTDEGEPQVTWTMA